jgi:AcrR family transcriptional regulator
MPKIVDHEKYKREVLEKCVEIFFEKGYSALTLKEIAASLDVSVGSLYYYFPSKNALFESMFQMVNERSLSELEQKLNEVSGKREKLQVIMDSAVTNPSLVQRQIVLSVDLMRNTIPIRAERMIFEWASAYLRLISEHLEISIDDARLLLTYLSGLIYASYLSPHQRMMKADIERFLELFYHSLNVH